MQIKRFGVSLKEDTLKMLDDYVNEKKFPNRSQAIRYLIHNNVVDADWKKNVIVAGAIVLVYDHHKRELQKKSTQVQHDFHHLILSVQHVHLDHDNCLETIAVKGKANDLLNLSNQLITLKGIKHGKLVMSSVK